MRRTLILDVIFIGSIMILLIFSTMVTPWGILEFIHQERYILGLLLSLLYLSLSVIISFIIYRYLEGESYTSGKITSQQFILPMIVPALLYVNLGFYGKNYLSFAASAVVFLMMFVIFKYLENKRSKVPWTKLHITAYIIMMISIWLISLIVGYAINYY